MEPPTSLPYTDPIPKLSHDITVVEVTKWIQAIRNLAKALIFDQAANALDPNQGHIYYQGWATPTVEWQAILNDEPQDQHPVQLAQAHVRRNPPAVDPIPHGNSSTGTFHLYNRSLAVRTAYNSQLQLFAHNVRQSINPTIQFTLAPNNDISSVPPTVIIDHVLQTYGTLTTNFLRHKMGQLDQFQCTTATEFVQESTRLTQLFQELHDCHQPIAEGNKILYLTKATAHIPEITQAITSYRTNTPIFGNQRYMDMTQFITEQLRNNPATTDTYNYANHVSQRPQPRETAPAAATPDCPCAFHPTMRHTIAQCQFLQNKIAHATIEQQAALVALFGLPRPKPK